MTLVKVGLSQADSHGQNGMRSNSITLHPLRRVKFTLFVHKVGIWNGHRSRKPCDGGSGKKGSPMHCAQLLSTKQQQIRVE